MKIKNRFMDGRASLYEKERRLEQNFISKKILDFLVYLRKYTALGKKIAK